MHQQIKTLQNIVTRKGSSKVLTFSAPHVLKSIFCLSNQKYVSRASFCREIRLGEGAVKTLISHLKEYEIADSIKSGTFLTKKGVRLAAQFYKAMPSQCFVKKCHVTNGKYNYAILLKKGYVSDVGNGMKQRDYAVLYGASGSLTLIFKDGEFVFPGDGVICFTDEPETREVLIGKLKPEEGDMVIMTSSDDRFVAEISAINTVLWTLGSEKN